jgi:hypothetical protein
METMRRMPPLNPLRAFEATARHMSMSRAANELNVTHGAVSHQVRALESTLKVPLFHRLGGTLQLTAQGAALLPTVTRAFGSIAEAVSLLAEPSREGQLSVCCLPSLMTFWLLPRLDRFSQVHPGIRLRLISGSPTAPATGRTASPSSGTSRPSFRSPAPLWSTASRSVRSTISTRIRCCMPMTAPSGIAGSTPPAFRNSPAARVT